MPGSIIIKTNPKDSTTKSDSGLIVVESVNKSSTEVAEIISVGDDRDDLREGTKILFPTSTGMKLDKNIFYLKYEDICAIIEE